MNGWIRLHRQILDWEWYSCPYTKSLFIHLLLKASWRDARWQGMEIPSGSLFCSVETLSAATGLSTRRVRTALERLKSTGEVTSRTTSRGTLLTLCKWEDYNGDDDEKDKPNDKPNDKQPTSERQTSDKRATTSEEGKEGKKGRKKEDKHVLRFARTESRDEFDAFIREVGLFANDAEWLWNKWEGNGWLNGNAPIKDWKATVRSWKEGQYFPSQKTGGQAKAWPVERTQPQEPEEEMDMMAMLRATIAKEEAELYKDHPDNWTPEEWAARQAIDNF